MKRKQVTETEQLNENPLVLGLMAALVGMGLEKEKAKKAAAQAVNQAQSGKAAPAPAKDYSAVMRQGSRGEGVKQLQQKLGMRQVDGIFGPATAKAVKTFQQSQGLQVDGVVGPETKARIDKLAGDSGVEGPEASGLGGQGMPAQQNASKENTGNPLNEASININGADAGEVAEILRMMQLAGADGAKVVGADDINPGPKPCPICGKIHGPSQPMGGCGAKPKEPGMGDMIKMMAPEEAVAEEDGPMGDEYDDEPSAPDEEYANDVSASIPAGNDLHKQKGSYPATAGGDNPMNTEDEDLEEQIKSQLRAALEARK